MVGKTKRKKNQYRRISAVIMAIAMIISVIPFPQGLFMITADAAQKMTATWTYTDTMKNSSGDVVTQLTGSGQTGTLTNGNDVLQLDGTKGKIAQRKSDNDFQVNGGASFGVPVISGAKSSKVTFTLRSGNWTNEDITVTGVTDSQISISDTSITVTCKLDGKTDNVGITMAYTDSRYIQTITAESSTSLAVTQAAFAYNHTSAEWTYNNGAVSASNSTSLIQKVTGTYTNGDGDVLFVDASNSGKFAPDGKSKIQVNPNTNITFPTVGDKAVLTLVLHKTGIDDTQKTDEVFAQGRLNLTGTGLLKAECVSIDNSNEDGSYRIVKINCYLDGEEGELTLGVLKDQINFKSFAIECETLQKKVIKGTVTSNSEIPAGTKVVATNTTTNLTYSSEITDCAYSIEVPAEGTSMYYDLSISDTEYEIASGVTTHSVVDTDLADITADLKISKLSTCAVTGSISGFDSDYDVSNLDILFTTDAETEYVPEVEINTQDNTFSAKVEKGVSYSVALGGVNDYKITYKLTDISFSEDGTLDIEVALKDTYAVDVTLPEEPDLTAKNIIYTYTNDDDNYVYTFTSKDSIKLRDGSYTLQLGGDFLAQPYKVKSGSSVTVDGKEATQTLAFEQITSWAFAVTDNGEYYKDSIQSTTGYYNGLFIDATTGKVVANGVNPNSAQFSTGAKIVVPVSGKCTISVEAYQANYALYTINGEKADTTNAVSTYRYDKSEAGNVEIISIDNNAYIKSISVVYDAKEVEFVEQKEMPKVYDYGNSASLVVQPEGQRLEFTQTGGTLNTVNKSINPSVSFYGFNETKDVNKITADIIIEECGNSSTNGIFFGAFNKDYIVTTGIRKGSELKMIYSKSETDLAGASSNVTGNYPVGTVVTFTAQKTDDALVITATPKDGKTQTATFDYTKNLLFKADGKNTSVSYGFVLAGVKVTVKNMKYEAQDGTVLYDQNNCYKAEGIAPVVKEVKAQPAATRDYIDVSWTNSVEADGDGMYVIQVSKDNGEWTDVDSAVTTTSYRYSISEAGSYKFRVCGKLGVNGERNAYATSENVDVIAALDSPVLNISSTESKVNLTWDKVNNATEYDIYRYSYDETSEKAVKIATVDKCEYEDTNVAKEMPYYYYAVANSYVNGKLDNYSNNSETVWTVPSAGHTGDYVYEDDAVKFTITKKSYDTVYNGKITIEGIAEQQATVSLKVNGQEVDSQSVEAKETFSFADKSINQGRNDVELLLTDTEGNVTRQTFNFVYLTNYDKVVDASYKGIDGDKVNGIETYKTVQSAVDSVSTSNTERVVILVKEGDYEEHLVVTSPYITLIGEDSEKTRIYYDTKEWVGGDMSLRCAVRIDKTATGFSAENLTIENTYNYLGDGSLSNESCDALRNDANNTSYINVRILGYQDTLCANGGTQYYYKCYIAGNVDFIYGNEPRALFNDTKLVFRYNANKNSGYVCAPKTSKDATYGLTFNNCQILSEDGCSGSKYYLARPWGADAYITWINCYMGKALRANASNPYTDMSGNLASNARFSEFGSFGPAYAINANRNQISKKKADSMVTETYLGWNVYSEVEAVAETYVGSVKTDVQDKYVEKEYVSDTYSEKDGDDTGLYRYMQEGYAKSAKTTGGGLLKETSDNYYTANSAEEFLKAIQSVKAKGVASVIEITSDIALGSNEVNNFDDYKAFITAHKLAPLTHPTLLKTGVSMLKLQDMSNLTIYSKNGAKITHVCIDITGSSNIIIRNIEFDEIWEWDDETEGGYDRNDWDYMTIEKGSSNIWIDHCTFYKAYDGVIDVKTPTNNSDITISWCEFLPASKNNTFFDEMMNTMKANPNNYPYYKHLLEEGMTDQQIYNYAYGQKKTHLLGQSDEDTSAKNITVTFANNYYKNSMDRMPRLRFGTAHVYNCIMDAQDLRDMRLDIENTAGPTLAQKIVSNGSSSNCGAHMLLENCYMSGMTNVLISGNGDSPAGYINALNTIYKLDNKDAELKVALNTTKEGEVALVQDGEEFKESLPYSDYTLYPASSLATQVKPYTGAGKLTLTTLQWEKTTYNDNKPEHEHTWDSGKVTKEATCTQAGEMTYTCEVCNDTKVEVIEATGHKFSTEWTIDKEATTTETGSKSHHCLVCDEKTDITEIPKKEEPTKPEETTKATESTKPEETTKATESTKPEETTKATESTKPEETTKATESTTAEETTKATESTTAEETTKATESTIAEETTKATESTTAEETTKATESTTAEETTKATESTTAEETTKATEVTKPEETTKATEVTKPEETTKATEVTKPEETTKATESTKPEETTKATESTKPEETTKATESTKPEETTKATESTKPEETTKATESTKPEETTKATESTTAEETTKATESTKPKETNNNQNGIVVDDSNSVVSNAKLSDEVVIVDEAGNKIANKDIKCVVKEASQDDVDNVNKSFKDNNIVIPNNSNVEYYDINLMTSNNVLVKIESGKVIITFNKKADVDYNNVDVYVYHLKSNGELEVLNPQLTDTGIVIEAESFSPYAIVTVPKSSIDNGKDNNKSDVNDNNNSNTNGNANSNNNANTNSNSNNNISGKSNTNNNTNAINNQKVQTGDTNNTMIYSIIAIIAILVVGGVVLFERKKKSSK